MNCDLCGKPDARYEYDCLAIKRTERPAGYNSKYVSAELDGCERHALCKKCMIKNALSRNNPFDGLLESNTGDNSEGILILIIIAIPIATCVGINKLIHSVPLAILLTLILFAGLFWLLAVQPSLKGGRKTAVTMSYALPNNKTTGENETTVSYGYIPVGDKIEYRKVNDIPPYVENGIREKVFVSLIQNGMWKMYVQQGIKSGKAVPEPEESADDDILAKSVRKLLRIYRQNPGGFIMYSDASEPVRKIGRELYEAGGKDLMLEAHAMFAASNPGLGLARNLEMVWDGIGGWCG